MRQVWLAPTLQAAVECRKAWGSPTDTAISGGMPWRLAEVPMRVQLLVSDFRKIPFETRVLIRYRQNSGGKVAFS